MLLNLFLERKIGRVSQLLEDRADRPTESTPERDIVDVVGPRCHEQP